MTTITDFKSWYNTGMSNPQLANARSNVPERGRNHKPYDRFMREQHGLHVPFWVALQRWDKRCKTEQMLITRKEGEPRWPFGTPEEEFITLKPPFKKPPCCSRDRPLAVIENEIRTRRVI